MSRIRKTIPGVDAELLIKDAAKLMPDSARRSFLRGAASLGALAFLTGCDLIDEDSAESVLSNVSRFNDRVQAALFSQTKLAPTYPESAITRPFPFNAYYDEDQAPTVDPATLEAGSRRPGRQQEAVDARRAARVARGLADHPPLLRRGLERHRLLAGRHALGFPEAHRRRHPRQVCLVQMRRGLHQHHRHGLGAASADADDLQIRPQAACRAPTASR